MCGCLFCLVYFCISPGGKDISCNLTDSGSLFVSLAQSPLLQEVFFCFGLYKELGK